MKEGGSREQVRREKTQGWGEVDRGMEEQRHQVERSEPPEMTSLLKSEGLCYSVQKKEVHLLYSCP